MDEPNPADLTGLAISIEPAGHVTLVTMSGSDLLLETDLDPRVCLLVLSFGNVPAAVASRLDPDAQRGFVTFGPGVLIPRPIDDETKLSWVQAGTITEWLEFLTQNESVAGGLVAAVEGFVAGAFPRRYANFAEIVLGVPAVLADRYREVADILDDAKLARSGAPKNTPAPEGEPTTKVDPMRDMSAAERRRWLASHADFEDELSGAMLDDSPDSGEGDADDDEPEEHPALSSVPDARPTRESARFPEIKQ